MARPKGVVQARNENKYKLPDGVILKPGQDCNYRKSTKLIFIDNEHGEFETTFKAIIDAGASTHYKAVNSRRGKTNIEKYGSASLHSNEGIRNKFKKTMIEKYGTENALENPELAQKSRDTLKANYGVETPMESPVIRERIKVNNIIKYGVDNLAKVQAKKFDINGISLKAYCKERDVPSSMAYRMVHNYSLESAVKWVDNYKESSSCLETEFKLLYPEAIRFETVPAGVKHFRPDFQINDKLFIDIDGLEYHSELHKKEKEYHQRKREQFNNAGLTILQFRQDELLKTPNIIKSIINAKSNKLSNKLYGRQLEIKVISLKEANEFYERTHLMGKCAGAKSLALVKDNKIYSCISYKRCKDNGIDIARFSNELEYSIVGGLSKFISYIEKNEKPVYIQSFVDLRYGNGNSLLIIGFSYKKTHLSFKWTDGYNTFNRMHCTANMDERRLTEQEQARDMKLFKIYDAGQALFIKLFQ